MKELVFPMSTAWESIRGLLLTYIIIIILPLIVRTISKKINNNEISKKRFAIIYIAYGLAVTALIFSLFNVRIKYTFDYISKRKVVATTTVEEIYIENHSYNIYYNGKLLSMGLGRDLKQDLEKNFVGHKCQIEYYDKSGIVISIKVLE